MGFTGAFGFFVTSFCSVFFVVFFFVGVLVDFFVTEPTVKDYLDHDVEGLKGVLEVLFDTLSVRVTLSEKEIAQFEFEDLTPSSDGLIDLKV